MEEDNFDNQPRGALIEEIRRLRRMRIELDQVPRTTREYYASVVLDNMYQFVTLMDTKGFVLTSNLPVLRAGGLTFSDVVGKPFWEAHWWQVNEETPKRLTEEIRQAYADKKFVRYEVDVFAGKGGNEIITIDFSLNPVINSDGQVMYLLAEGRNITEKKAAEAKLEEQNKQLQELYKRIKVSTFVNIVLS
jgi:PAS domain S-box-containing protein